MLENIYIIPAEMGNVNFSSSSLSRDENDVYVELTVHI